MQMKVAVPIQFNPRLLAELSWVPVLLGAGTAYWGPPALAGLAASLWFIGVGLQVAAAALRFASRHI